MLQFAEYIWLDGNEPTQTLRSKTRVLPATNGRSLTLADLPQWSFDGSSTNQADGGDSDLLLEPVAIVADPIRGGGSALVMCEVMNADGTPHRTNSRAELRDVLNAGAEAADPWVGFEQEYTLFDGLRPLGWPTDGYPAPQGPFYFREQPRQRPRHGELGAAQQRQRPQAPLVLRRRLQHDREPAPVHSDGRFDWLGRHLVTPGR